VEDLKMRTCIKFGAASLIVACAGHAFAQPTIDGSKDAVYGDALWVNPVTTGFGNASASAPCDGSGLGGDPAAVNTGMEFSIPLSAIGLATNGQIGMCVFFSGGGHNFISNQFLPGLPNGTPNFGNPPANVDLNNSAGTQHIFFTAATVATAPTIDGTRDSSYGAPLALQTARTGFGNSTNGATAISNGSELNGLYAVVSGDRLYVMVTGNQSQDFTQVEFFFDSIAGQGQNVLRNDNPSVDFNNNNNLAGLTFDAGFAPDYNISWGSGNGGGNGEFYPNYVRLRVSDTDLGNGDFLFCDVPGNGINITCGGNSINMLADINHSNIAGVGALCPAPSGTVEVANGSELNALYAYADDCTNKLYVMLTGNLESQTGSPCSNGGNKVMFFIDADGATEGQNTLRSDNLGFSFNALRNMGPGGTDAGLTFDAGFFADYFMLMKVYKEPATLNMDACVLRANGPTNNGTVIDYGAFDGGLFSLPAYSPVTFSGANTCDPTIAAGDPDIFPTAADSSDKYTSFAPRAVYNSFFTQAVGGAPFPIQPVGTPGLIRFDVDNSNVGGVQGDNGTVSDAVNVTTGFEIEIDLDEIGWDGTSPIKIVAFITSPDGTFTSNQIVGLTAQQGNLGSTRAINFANIAGNQFGSVTVTACSACPACPADYNQDGGVTGDDIAAFFADFEAGTGCADTNVDGGITGDDIASFFTVFEAGGC